MKKVNIEKRVKKVISRRHLANDSKLEMSKDTRMFEDLGFDSIRILELLVFLEDEFAVEVPDNAYINGSFDSVGAIVMLFDELTKEN